MSMCEGFDRAIGGSRVGDDLKDDWKWRRHARNPDRVNTGVRMGGWMMWAESGWFVLATQEEWWGKGSELWSRIFVSYYVLRAVMSRHAGPSEE
ncbi:hypothetical protein HZH68_015140 [Vespula germanica]|uniref:Uncharacterized protein n=1 Tax=Vespula germanica TaxID=30212 RepID=A0A834J924_VESGE|nr:hypothetical protein HZH68_015140 [Vespula germanica]